MTTAGLALNTWIASPTKMVARVRGPKSPTKVAASCSGLSCRGIQFGITPLKACCCVGLTTKVTTTVTARLDLGCTRHVRQSTHGSALARVRAIHIRTSRSGLTAHIRKYPGTGLSGVHSTSRAETAGADLPSRTPLGVCEPTTGLGHGATPSGDVLTTKGLGG